MKLVWSIKIYIYIRGQTLTFIRGVGPQNDKAFLRRRNMKEILIIYIREVSNIGSKK